MKDIVHELKQKIAEIERRIGEYGLSTLTGGNVSALDPERKLVVITPSGLNKRTLTPDDMVVLNMNGDIIEGKHKPSIESVMHLAIYKEISRAKAIIHAHPPMVTTLSIVGKGIPPITEELIEFAGEQGVPVSRYACTGSIDLAKEVINLLKISDAVIMQNHGIVVIAPDLESAFNKLFAIEFVAGRYVYASILGKPRTLTLDEIKRVVETIDKWSNLKIVKNIYKDWLRK